MGGGSGGRQGDWLRQGNALEAALVDRYEEPEDHVLTEFRLEGLRVLYAACPDAAEAEVVPAGAPPGRGAAILGGRYRVHRSAAAAVPPAEYIEVKKTSHLAGRSGAARRGKFWLQGALLGVGRVVVATTGRDGLVVTALRSFALEDLKPEAAARVWAGLARMLRHVVEATAADGHYQLSLRGAGRVALHVEASGPDADLEAVARAAEDCS